MKNLLSHWKTTSAGVVAIVGGIVLIVNDHTKITEGVTAILAGVGLMFAADSSNTETK